MTTQYIMKAFDTITSSHVRWAVLGSPDFTGSQSGYNPANLTGIVVDYQLAVPINGNGGVVGNLAGGDLTGTYPNPNIESIGGQSVTTGVQTVFNVKVYGATGNGTTDDTDAITNCISAAVSAEGQIYFPVGTYITTSQNLPANTIIFGDGINSIIKAKSTTSGPLLSINGNSNIVIKNLQLDCSTTAACTFGISMTNATSVKITDVIIYGGEGSTGIGCTTAGIGILGSGGFNCYGIHIDHSVIYYCAGDGIQILPGNTNADIVINNGCVIGSNDGYGINVNSGASTASEVHIDNNVLQANALGEIVGSFWGGSINGNHLESVAFGSGTSQVKITGSNRFLGMSICNNFFENHRTGGAGSYCIEINPTVICTGLVMHGNFFDLFTSAGAYVANIEAAQIGPNYANGTTYAPGYFPAGVSVFDSGGIYDQTAIVRTFAPGQTSMLEEQGSGLQTTNNTPATLMSYPITVAGFGAASSFTGVVDFKATIIGRDTTAASTKTYKCEVEGLFYNRAGTVTATIASNSGIIDQSSGAIGTPPTLTSSGTNAVITVTGPNTATWDWGVIYRVVARP